MLISGTRTALRSVIRVILLPMRKYWNQFCSFTSIAGFRFMTTRISFAIRAAAISIFSLSILGFALQIVNVVRQYMESRVIISSLNNRADTLALPLIYVCMPLKGSGPVPLLNICRSAREPDKPRSATEIQRVDRRLRQFILRPTAILSCSYEVASVSHHCQLRCKWTAHGYCIEARMDKESSDGNDARNGRYSGNGSLDLKAVPSFDIRLLYNSNGTDALVFLDSYNPLIDNETVPLVGAAHMLVEDDSLNILSVIEILKIVREDVKLPDSSRPSYEFCIWERYSRLQRANTPADCTTEIYSSLFAKTDFDYANITYEFSECALARAELAMADCESDNVFNRIEVSTGLFQQDEISEKNGALTERAREASAGAFGDSVQSKYNIKVFVGSAEMRNTTFKPKDEKWKLMSDAGGSISLYIGFTLMSLLEVIAFVSVRKVRKDALQVDDETVMERKNPPIRKLVKAAETPQGHGLSKS